jgi:tetratricopeptide (TPR) repeat protein
MSTRRLPLIPISVCVCLLAGANIALAQHEPASGGGTIGGGSTSRPSTKPATKPATKPPAGATTPRTSTSTGTKPRVNRPTASTGSSSTGTTGTTGRTTPATTTTAKTAADSYYQQGETLYNAQKYKEALDLYLKAAQLNPSMSTALYRIGWIFNDLEDYD